MAEIVNRRNKVAHTANALDIGRAELRESVRFLRIVAVLLDCELAQQVRKLIRMST